MVYKLIKMYTNDIHMHNFLQWNFDTIEYDILAKLYAKMIGFHIYYLCYLSQLVREG